jgi:benzoate/toluate 1,2-dioxygenase reductase subunit
LLRDALVHGGECDAYLCGPPPMIDAAQRWLAAHAVPPARIHAERFLPS